jgi:molybdopterin-containing oxidoreductase family membrane subunit
MIGGFTPNMFEGVTSYWPSWQEIGVSMMVFSVGALVITVLFKIATDVKQELQQSQQGEDVPGPQTEELATEEAAPAA